jgi:aspartate carbamoyltransferase catalytic subunit
MQNETTTTNKGESMWDTITKFLKDIIDALWELLQRVPL